MEDRVFQLEQRVNELATLVNHVYATQQTLSSVQPSKRRSRSRSRSKSRRSRSRSYSRSPSRKHRRAEDHTVHVKNLQILGLRGYENIKNALYKELSRFGDIERVHVSGSEVWANVTFADDRDARECISKMSKPATDRLVCVRHFPQSR